MFKKSALLVLIFFIFYNPAYAVERSLLLRQLKGKPEYRPLYAAVLVLRERAQNPAVLRRIKNRQHDAVGSLLRIFATNNDTSPLSEYADIRDKLSDQLTYKTYPILFNAVDCMCGKAQNGAFLRKASRRGHQAVVVLLLGCGANVNRRSKAGKTALMVASKRVLGVEKILEEAGAQE